MTCQIIRDLFSDYIEGSLNDFDKVRVEKHCEECVYCRKELEALENVVKEIKTQDEYDVPHDLRENVRHALTEKNWFEKLKNWVIGGQTPFFKWQTAGVVISAFLILIIFSSQLDELTKKPKIDEEAVKEEKAVKIATKKDEKALVKQPKIKAASRAKKRKTVKSVATLNKKTTAVVDVPKKAPEYESVDSGLLTVGLGGARRSLESDTSKGLEAFKGEDKKSISTKDKLEEKVGEVVEKSLSIKTKEIPTLSQNFVVKGKVVAKNEEGNKLGVQGVRIIATIKSGLSQETYTDKNGNFALVLKRGENYTINISKKGYKSKSISNLNQENYSKARKVVLEK